MYLSLTTTDGQKLTFAMPSDIKVFLNGKHTGLIRYDQLHRVYRYWPKGSKTSGDGFTTIEECQESLR